MQYKIVFFGTSKFACPSIEMLSKHHNLLALVTSPSPSPAKEVAQRLGIKILQPPTPNIEDFVHKIKNLEPDLICLAAYGYILSPEILGIPKLASINLHPSLLPAYRGAAPIQRAIINGEKYTGVTTFIMDPQIDQGDILLQKKTEILHSETHGELEAKLSEMGADLLLETIDKFKELKPIPQQADKASYAPKISKEMRKINWQKPATEIVNLIRALSPKPAAYTTFRGKQLEILLASECRGESATLPYLQGEPGKIIKVKGNLVVGTASGCVELKLLKPEAKREQTALDFINGYHPQVGETME